jgi:DNA (cytosine-5)-methyltransferase 1
MPDRPRLLDLFCGAGGAGMGYHRAGFEVVGVDNAPQRRYPFEFHLADALEFVAEHGAEYDVIHASPPCQAYSIMRNLPWLRGREYWDSIPPTRAALVATGVPYVIENVARAPLDGIMLCGTMFGLRQSDGGPEYRHRLFESSVFMLAPAHPKHHETVVPGPYLKDRQRRSNGAWRSSGIDRSIAGKGGHVGDAARFGAAMGIDWMTGAELAQAIPPAFTEWIGGELLRGLAWQRAETLAAANR